MKVLVLNGSPKEQSDTMCITNAFLDGIRKTGDHEIEVIDIIKHDIKPCVGCFYCWKKLEGSCVINDYQNVILDKIKQADTIIWSFPLYCCGMPSHVKAVIDRMIPLSKMGVREDGKVTSRGVVDFSKKRYLVFCGSGFPLGVAHFEAVKVQCLHMFGRMRMLCINETPLMHVPSAKPYTEPLLEKFTAAGEEFAKTSYLCRTTVEGLETPMLPNDEYLRLAGEEYKKSL